MSKIEGTYAYLDKIANNFKNHIDTNGEKLNKAEALYSYSELLKEKTKNPVGMTIAIRDMLENNPIENVYEFGENLNYLERNPQIDLLVKKLEKSEESFAKIQNTKEDLIFFKRINHGFVTPKLTGIRKLILRFKLMLA